MSEPTTDLRTAIDDFNESADLVQCAREAVARMGGQLTRRKNGEWCGPCPMDCNGEGNDRFVTILKPKGGGVPFAFCRKCRRGADPLKLAMIAHLGRPPEGGKDTATFLKEKGLLIDDPNWSPRSRRRTEQIDEPQEVEDAHNILCRAVTLTLQEARRDGQKGLSPELLTKLLACSMDELRGACRTLVASGRIRFLSDPTRVDLA